MAAIDKSCFFKISKSYDLLINSSDVTLTFSPMRPYWCDKHELWHIGHNKKERMEYTSDGARILPNTGGTEILSEDDARYIPSIRENEY